MSSKKPLIICGGGVRYSEAAEQLSTLQKHSIFLLQRLKRVKSAVVSEHSFNVGGVGETGCLAANLLAKRRTSLSVLVLAIQISLLPLNGSSKNPE